MAYQREIQGRTADDFLLRKLARPQFELVFQCKHCLNVRSVDVLMLVARYGPDVKLEALRFCARCDRCGKRKAHALLRQPDSVGPSRGWFPHKPLDGR